MRLRLRVTGEPEFEKKGERTRQALEVRRAHVRVRLRVSGKSRQSGSKLHELQTLARAPKPPDFAKRLECVKLASAFGSERLSATFNRTQHVLVT